MRYGEILTVIALVLLVACKSTTPPPAPQGNQPPPVQYEQGLQAPSVGPRTFTPGVPVAPIQHNPFTVTTNDPAVTVPVQQPVSITTTNAIAFIANGLMATTNAVNGMLNVHSYGATGNGTTVDTVALQAAINSAASQNTGIFLPPGNYKTGRLIWTAGFRGMAGVPTYSATKNSLQFVAYLTLANGANTNLLYIPPGSYGSVRDVCFVGNRTNQTAGAALVYVDIANYTGFIRNETVFRNCAFIWGKSHGIENHREELVLDNCMMIENDGDGIHFVDAVDNTICNDTGTGRNGGWGLALIGNSSANRIIHADTFSNHRGGLLLDGLSPAGGNGQEQNSFIRLQANDNLGPNIMVTNIVAKMVWTDCFIAGANFDDDGNGFANPWPTGTWPDILFAENEGYQTMFSFEGCRIGLISGTVSTKLPSYHIHDARNGTNSFGGSSIYTNGLGMTIQGGYVYFGGTTTGTPIYPTTFTENAMCLTEDGNGQFYRTRLSHNDVIVGESFISDSDNGRFKLYKATNLLFALEMMQGPTTNHISTNYLAIDTNRLMSIPGGLKVSGDVTNMGSGSFGDVIYFKSSAATNYTAKLYALGTNGGIGLADGFGQGATNFWGFDGSNGLTRLPGPIKMATTPTSPLASEVGGNAWAIWNSGNVFRLLYSSDGTNLFTVATLTNGGNAVFSFLQPTNMSPSTLGQTDGNGVLVSLVNQASSVLLNNGSNPLWFAGKTTNINVLCDGGVTNQFQFVSGVLSNVVAVP